MHYALSEHTKSIRLYISRRGDGADIRLTGYPASISYGLNHILRKIYRYADSGQFTIGMDRISDQPDISSGYPARIVYIILLEIIYPERCVCFIRPVRRSDGPDIRPPGYPQKT